MTSVTHAGTSKVPAFYLDRRQLACAVSAAALGVLAYPKAGISLFGWLMCAPLGMGALRCRGALNAAFYGWLGGFVFYAGLLYWLAPTCVAGGLNPALAALALVCLAALLAIEWLVFSAALYRFKNSGAWFALAAALCWVCMEWVKQLAARHAVWFPWFMLGYTQYKNPAVLQTAAFTGVYGVSFLLAFFGFGAGFVFTRGRQWRRAALVSFLPALVLGVVVWCAGVARLKHAPPQGDSVPTPAALPDSDPAYEAPIYNVAVLQPNIEQYRKWDAQFEAFIYNRLSAQIELLSRARPVALEFVLWPESAVPGYIETARYGGLVAAAARKTGAAQILGAPSSARGRTVSAFLFDKTGAQAGAYDKRKLVPFGEYVPLRGLLGRFAGVLNQLGEFEPGAKNQPLMKTEHAAIGAGICYEAIFPYLWRERAARGAQVFVSMTNDGWYLKTAGPYQHFAANVLRAVENGVPLVRAANTGISGGIDRWGRIVVASDLDSCNVLIVPVRAARRTPYAKAGDWFAALCAFLLCAGAWRLGTAKK
ncbi:MAG: apolipoprotein N-acyltransferase [Elusimicrobiaceae bacterium]|nr:apolipoprotein N-acyltransferase [Elusimicrobiaceae bacterium]